MIFVLIFIFERICLIDGLGLLMLVLVWIIISMGIGKLFGILLGLRLGLSRVLMFLWLSMCVLNMLVSFDI